MKLVIEVEIGQSTPTKEILDAIAKYSTLPERGDVPLRLDERGGVYNWAGKTIGKWEVVL